MRHHTQHGFIVSSLMIYIILAIAAVGFIWVEEMRIDSLASKLDSANTKLTKANESIETLTDQLQISLKRAETLESLSKSAKEDTVERQKDAKALDVAVSTIVKSLPKPTPKPKAKAPNTVAPDEPPIKAEDSFARAQAMHHAYCLSDPTSATCQPLKGV